MESIRYISSLLTFYLKGEIKSEQNFIHFKTPNTILGLIPLGAINKSVSIHQIDSVTTNFKLRVKKLIIGWFLLFIAFTALKESIWSVMFIFLLLAVNSFLDAFEVDLTVSMTSGHATHIDFFIFEKAKAELAANQINEMIGNRLSDTNTREQTDRIVEAINSK